MKASLAVKERQVEKRRHRRRKVWLPAVLYSTGAEGASAWIRDISCKGAMIETDAPMREGRKVTLVRKGLETAALVAWTKGRYAGLLFEQPFSEKTLVEYSLPRAPLKLMLKVHGPRRGRRDPASA